MNIPFLSLKDVTALHGAEINEAVRRVVNGGWYLQGQENERFEQNYANFIGTKYCIGCANGLDALIWIFRAYIEMGVMQPGDEVIVPANTYIATILAITENGLTPVLCEPKLNTLEIDDNLVESLITPKTKAVAIVHLYGRIAYTHKIGELCKKVSRQSIEAISTLSRSLALSISFWYMGYMLLHLLIPARCSAASFRALLRSFTVFSMRMSYQWFDTSA